MNCLSCKHKDVCKFKNHLAYSFIGTYASEIANDGDFLMHVSSEIATNGDSLICDLYAALAKNCKHYDAK